ncbi:MAG: hypothetical protein ACI867_002456, partial [Glaciecola sp.]
QRAVARSLSARREQDVRPSAPNTSCANFLPAPL